VKWAPLAQFNQRREEPGQRLAAAGWRDQQRRAPGFGLLQQCKLVRARLPAAQRKPTRKNIRQLRWGVEKIAGGFH